MVGDSGVTVVLTVDMIRKYWGGGAKTSFPELRLCEDK